MKIYKIPFIGQVVDKSEIDLLQTHLDSKQITIDIQLEEIKKLKSQILTMDKQIYNLVNSNEELRSLEYVNKRQHNNIIKLTKQKHKSTLFSYIINPIILISTTFLICAIWHGY